MGPGTHRERVEYLGGGRRPHLPTAWSRCSEERVRTPYRSVQPTPLEVKAICQPTERAKECLEEALFEE